MDCMPLGVQRDFKLTRFNMSNVGFVQPWHVKMHSATRHQSDEFWQVPTMLITCRHTYEVVGCIKDHVICLMTMVLLAGMVKKLLQ